MKTTRESREILRDRAKYSGGTMTLSSSLVLSLLEHIESLEVCRGEADRLATEVLCGGDPLVSAKEWRKKWGIK